MSDIRYALRTLIKRPGPTLVIVATLGVAIASATVIYSVVDVVWHFIPAVNQDRLVYVASTDTRVVQAAGGSRRVVLRTPASIVTLLAAYIPARRAAHIDPLRALRQD